MAITSLHACVIKFITMKKAFLLLPFVFLTACQPKSSTPESAPLDQTQSETIDETQQMAKLVAQGKPVACVVTDKKTKSSYTYKMINKKVRISGMTTTGNTDKSSMLIDEENMYIWDENKMTGMKWAIPNEDEAKKLAEQQGQSIPDLSTEESRKKYVDMGFTINCEGTTVNDADFIPPADVTFSDFSSLMDASKQLMQNPTGTMSPEQQKLLQQQSEDMMKQFQGQ